MSFPEPLQWNGDEEPDTTDPVYICDRCDGECSRPIILPFGYFCSGVCADAEEGEFAERMKRRGFQEVQPEIFDNPFGD
jgi:hypothetical protein